MSTIHLSKGPLRVCLAMLRFSPIELIGGEYNARIQDTFRKNGLPNFASREQVENTIDGERKIQPQWLFYDLDQTELVVISSSSFAYQAFSYLHFEAFKDRMFKLFELFCSITDFYKGTILTFLGLRYINAIESSDWTKYLTESFHGMKFPKNLIDDTAHQYQSMISQGITNIGNDDHANLIVRTMQNRQGVVYPPDITVFSQPSNQSDALITILDIDHFAMLQEQPKGSDFIHDLLDRLHEGSEQVFFNAISEQAIKEWK